MSRDIVMQAHELYFSYLVRVWIKQPDTGEASITAEVHSVQNGQTWQFAGLQQALEFLTQQVAGATKQ